MKYHRRIYYSAAQRAEIWDRWQRGEFIIPTNMSWVENLRREFRAFPGGKYDDQIDSISPFEAWVHGSHRKALFSRNLETGRRSASRKPVRRRV